MTMEIPEGWVSCQIGEVVTIVSGGTPPSKDLTNFTAEGGIPWITPADLSGYKDIYISRGARNLTEKGFAACSATKIRPGSVLFSSRAPVGYVAIASNEVTTNQGFKSFVLPDELDSRFVYFYLRHIKPIAELMATGTTFKELSGSAAAQLPLVIAPLNEQKRIADKLDVLLARIDACQQRLDRIPLILKHFRQAVLAAATLGQLTEDWRTKHFKESDSNNYNISGKLAAFADVIDPNPSHRYPSYEGGTIPLLATEQMSGLDAWDISSAKLTTSDFYEARKAAHDFFDDDIIFARKGRLGLARNPPQNISYVFSHTVFIIRAKAGKILPAYLLWFLRQEWCIEWLLLEMNSNAGVPTLGKAVMERLPVHIPNYIEQQEIVHRIENLFAYADRLEAHYQAACANIKRLTPVLLAKAFRGELVSQDPNDESASALLERICANRAAQLAKAKRSVTPRKKTMPKMTKESVKEAIRKFPNEKFSFDELRENFTGDYDSLKDILFALLSEAEPILTQVFDQEERAMRFFRAGK